jgi:hypothetical protein
VRKNDGVGCVYNLDELHILKTSEFMPPKLQHTSRRHCEASGLAVASVCLNLERTARHPDLVEL